MALLGLGTLIAIADLFTVFGGCDAGPALYLNGDKGMILGVLGKGFEVGCNRLSKGCEDAACRTPEQSMR